MENTKRNKGGRPTKYRPEFIDKVDDFLQECRDEHYDYVKSEGMKGGRVTEQKIIVRLPTIERFAKYLGVAVSSLNLWAIEYPLFSVALGKIIEEQRLRLLDKGLSGDYNPTIAKLILSSNHGMAERKDITSKDQELRTLTGFNYVEPGQDGNDPSNI